MEYMFEWSVEISEDFLVELEGWDEEGQLEFDAAQRELEKLGPEGVGLFAAELEGYPDWDQRGSYTCRIVPVPTPSGELVLELEIWPLRHLIIVTAQWSPAF